MSSLRRAPGARRIPLLQVKDLRLRFALWVLIILLPLLVYQLIGISVGYRQEVDAKLSASQRVAESVALGFDNFVESLWNVEWVLGTAIYRAGFTPEVAGAILSDHIPRYPQVDSLVWLSPTGEVLASSGAVPVGMALEKGDYLDQVLHGESSKVVSNMTRCKLNGKLVVVVIRAIHNEAGDLVGAVGARVLTEKLGSIIQRAGSSLTFGLVDQGANIVYYQGDPALLMDSEQNTDESPLTRALRGEVALVPRAERVDGKLGSGAIIPIAKLGWAVFVVRSLDEMRKAARSAAWRETLLLLLVGAVSWAIGIWVINGFLSRLNEVRKAAMAISQGDLSARANLNGTDVVATTAEAFDHMANQLQEAETERSRFLQIAAHELRNPMAALKGVCALINRRLASGRSIQDLPELIDREIDRLSSFLNEVLEAFRVQRGQLDLRRKAVNLAKVVKASLGMFLAGYKPDRFVVSVPNDPVWVIGDSQRLEDVLRNLIGNALKYSSKDSTVEITLQVHDDKASISVKDEGIGIPPDQQSKVFNAFFRASNVGYDGSGGIGLGLFVCKETVDQHGGRIWVESNEGEGSTFFLELPLAPDEFEKSSTGPVVE